MISTEPAGLPSAITMQLLGHSDADTHDGYPYLTPEDEALARETLAARFAPDGDTSE